MGWQYGGLWWSSSAAAVVLFNGIRVTSMTLPLLL